MLETLPAPTTTHPVRCPHFGPCGGCTSLDVPYLDEVRAKEGKLRTAFPGSHLDANTLLAPTKSSPIPAGAEHVVRQAFSDSLHRTFVTTFAIACLGILTVLLMPRGSATAIRDRARGHVQEEPLTPEGDTFVIADELIRVQATSFTVQPAAAG